MSETLGPPTVKDYGVAIEILKQAGLAGIERAVLLGGSNAESERRPTTVVVGILALPAIALAVWRAERVMAEARRDGDGPC